MQKKNYLRKTLALVMAFLMIVTMMPVNVFAQDPQIKKNVEDSIESSVGNKDKNAIHAYVGIQVGGDLNMKLQGNALDQQFKPIAGVRAYFQWFEKGGYASPVYTAVSDAQGRLNIGCKPYVAADGKIIKFDADTTVSGGNEKYRFWIDDENLPDSFKKDYQLQYITGENVVFPSDNQWVSQGGATTDVVPNTISDMKILFMEKPKAFMHKAKPTETPAVRTGIGSGGTVWGKVTWDYESPSGGVQWGIVATPSSPAKGVKIKASYLSDYALKQIYSDATVARMNLSSPDDIRGSKWSYALETQLQKWIQEQVKQEPDKWIAETVITPATGTNAEGNYIIQFNGTWGPARNKGVYNYTPPALWPQAKKDRIGTVAASPNDGSFAVGIGQDTKHINIDWMFISADDTEDLRLMTPFNNNWFTGTSGLTGNWGIHSGWAQAAFGVTTAVDTNNNIRADFGFGSPGVNFEITNYDSEANTALPGDIAQTKTTGLPYKVSSDSFVIVWYDPNGKEVGRGTPQKPSSTGTIDSAPLDTSKLTINETTEYTAKLYRVKPGGKLEDQPIAADSFTVEVSHLFISRYDDVSIVNPKASDKEMKDATYSATGLPEALTMEATTGTIKGKAKTAGLYKAAFKIILPDKSGNIEGTRDRYIAVTDSPLKAGEVGVAYSQDVKPEPAKDPKGKDYIYKMKSVNFISGKEIEGLKVEGDATNGFKITGIPTKEAKATEDVLDGDPGPNVEVTYDIYKKNDTGKEVLVAKGHKDLVPLVVRPIVIIPQDPSNPGDTPAGYHKVTFDATANDGNIGGKQTYSVFVLDGKTIQEAEKADPKLTIPTVTVTTKGKEHTAWTVDTAEYKKDLSDYKTAVTADVKFTAKYEDKKVVIIPEDPSNPGDTPAGYHKVTFDATANDGNIGGKQTYSVFVLDGKTIQEAEKADPKLTIPTVTVTTKGKEHTAWTVDTAEYKKDLSDYKTAVTADVKFTAKYEDKKVVIIPEDPSNPGDTPAGYHKVTFDATANDGNIGGKQTYSVFVLDGKTIQEAEKADPKLTIPTVTVTTKGKEHTAWTVDTAEYKKDLSDYKTAVTADVKFTAKYEDKKVVIIPEDPSNPGDTPAGYHKVTFDATANDGNIGGKQTYSVFVLDGKTIQEAEKADPKLTIPTVTVTTKGKEHTAWTVDTAEYKKDLSDYKTAVTADVKFTAKYEDKKVVIIPEDPSNPGDTPAGYHKVTFDATANDGNIGGKQTYSVFVLDGKTIQEAEKADPKLTIPTVTVTTKGKEHTAWTVDTAEYKKDLSDYKTAVTADVKFTAKYEDKKVVIIPEDPSNPGDTPAGYHKVTFDATANDGNIGGKQTYSVFVLDGKTIQEAEKADPKLTIPTVTVTTKGKEHTAWTVDTAEYKKDLSDYKTAVTADVKFTAKYEDKKVVIIPEDPSNPGDTPAGYHKVTFDATANDGNIGGKQTYSVFVLDGKTIQEAEKADPKLTIPTVTVTTKGKEHTAWTVDTAEYKKDLSDYKTAVTADVKFTAKYEDKKVVIIPEDPSNPGDTPAGYHKVTFDATANDGNIGGKQTYSVFVLDGKTIQEAEKADPKLTIPTVTVTTKGKEHTAWTVDTAEYKKDLSDYKTAVTADVKFTAKYEDKKVVIIPEDPSNPGDTPAGYHKVTFDATANDGNIGGKQTYSVFVLDGKTIQEAEKADPKLTIPTVTVTTKGKEHTAWTVDTAEYKKDLSDYKTAVTADVKFTAKYEDKKVVIIPEDPSNPGDTPAGYHKVTFDATANDGNIGGKQTYSVFVLDGKTIQEAEKADPKLTIPTVTVTTKGKEHTAWTVDTAEYKKDLSDYKTAVTADVKFTAKYEDKKVVIIPEDPSNPGDTPAGYHKVTFDATANDGNIGGKQTYSVFVLDGKTIQEAEKADPKLTIPTVTVTTKGKEHTAWTVDTAEYKKDLSDYKTAVTADVKFTAKYEDKKVVIIPEDPSNPGDTPAGYHKVTFDATANDGNIGGKQTYSVFVLDGKTIQEAEKADPKLTIPTVTVTTKGKEHTAWTVDTAEYKKDLSDYKTAVTADVKFTAKYEDKKVVIIPEDPSNPGDTPAGYHKVTFDATANDGNIGGKQTYSVFVLDGKTIQEAEKADPKLTIPTVTVTTKGKEHTAWTVDTAEYKKDLSDYKTAVTADVKFTAKYEDKKVVIIPEDPSNPGDTPAGYHKVTFDATANDGNIGGKQTYSVFVLDGKTIQEAEKADPKLTIPTVTVTTKGKEHTAWTVDTAEYKKDLSDYKTAVTADVKFTAKYEDKKVVIIPEDPSNPGDTPAGYHKVTFDATANDGNIGGKQTYSVFVLDGKTIQEAEKADPKLTIPTVTVTTKGKEHTAWTVDTAEYKKDLSDYKTAVTADVKFTAKYEDKKVVIIPEDPSNPGDTPAGYHKVTFDATANDGNIGGKQTYSVFVLDGKTIQEAEKADPKLTIPTVTVTTKGKEHTAWTVDTAEYKKDLSDYKTAVTADVKFTAKYEDKKVVIIPEDPSNPGDTPAGYHKVTFDATANDGNIGGKQTYSVFVLDGKTIQEAEKADPKLTIPTVTVTTKGKEHTAWTVDTAEYKKDLSDYKTAVTADVKFTAKYEDKKVVIIPEDPSNPGDTPAGYHKVTFDATANDGNIGGKQTYSVFVLDGKTIQEAEKADPKLTIPTVTVTTKGKEHTAWTVDTAEYKKDLSDYKTAVTADVKFTAKYEDKKVVIIPEDPSNPGDTPAGYHKVTFDATANDGNIGGKQTYSVFVLDGKTIQEAEKADPKLTIPTVTVTTKGKEHTAWTVDTAEYKKDLSDYKTAVTADVKFTAKYEDKKVVIIPEDPSNPGDTPAGYHKVTFDATANDGNIGGKQTYSVFVLDGKTIQEAEKADPKLTIPTVTVTTKGKEHTAWTVDTAEYKKDLSDYKTAVTADVKFTAKYEDKKVVIIPEDPSNPGDTPAGYHKVTFDATANDGNIGGKQTYSVFVLDGKTIQEAEKADPKLTIPTVTVTTKGKEHTAWTVDTAEYKKDLSDYKTAVTADVKFTAKYEDKKVVIIPEDPSNPGDTPAGYHKVTFDATANDGNIGGKQTYSVFVLDGKTIQEAEKADPKLTIPTVTVTTKGKEHTAWTVDTAEYKKDLSDYKTAVTADVKFTAKYEDKKVVIIPEDPSNPGDTPAGYHKVTFDATANDGNIGGKQTYSVFVLDGKTIQEAEKADPKLTIPTVTVTTKGKEHTAWTVDTAEYKKDLSDYKTAVTADVKFTAKYEDKKVVIIPEDPSNPGDTPAGYHKVTFDATANDGNIGGKQTYSVFVLDGKTIQEAEKADPKLTIPTVTVTTKGKEHTAWTVDTAEYKKDLSDYKTAVTADVKFTAKYEDNTPTIADKDNYDPHYEDKSGKPGETVQIDPPTFTKKGEQGTVPAPTTPTKGTTFTKNDKTQTNVTVDPNTGAITVVIPQDAKVGDVITIPVKVTYPDGSNEPVDVKVTVGEDKTKVKYPNTEVEKGKTETVTPIVTDNDGKPVPEDKVGTPTVTNTNDLPGGVTVTPKNNGKVDITVPDGYDGPKDFTVKVTVPVDGKDVESEIKITVKDKTTPPTPTYNYITLTLDENYRSGEITHYDVIEGELIERYLYTPRRRGYIFKGWSYDSRRLEEVRPGDRIYYPTTLYAIWTKQKAKDDEEVEPIDTRAVNEHKAYMFGYTDGSVRPNGSITRAEAAALVTRLLGIEANASSMKPAFTDTPSSWYNKAINAAVARGIMKGYPDGRFRPNAPITRAEFTQMISTIDNKPYGVAPFADVKGHWAERAIGSEYQAGRITGYPDGTFRPNAFITRCEAVVILNKIFERNYDAMSAMNAKNKESIKRFIDLTPSFWGFNDMVEATNTHDFKRRRPGFVEEDWTLVK